MGITIFPLGGYGEVGANCTAIDIDGDLYLFDLGLHMEKFISLTSGNDDITTQMVVAAGAVPDLSVIEDRIEDVQGIFLSHAHLDHVGAIPFLAGKFGCDIHGTPFTIEVVQTLCRERGTEFHQDFVKHPPGNTAFMSKKCKVEFIPISHSVPQASVLAIHTPYGTIIYANDFKLDDTPVVGDRPDYKRLKALKGKVIACIMECLYAPKDGHTPSESQAKHKLMDALLHHDVHRQAVIVTTFSSHIARIKTILECADHMNRQPVFCGRSLANYLRAAEVSGVIKLPSHAEILAFKSSISRFFKHNPQPERYLYIVTGHQGEPNAVLSRMTQGTIPFRFKRGDRVVFSCNIIPTDVTREHRQRLENGLKKFHVLIEKNIHSSGHAYGDDIERFIEMLDPAVVVPSHGDSAMMNAMKDRCKNLGVSCSFLEAGSRLELE